MSRRLLFAVHVAAFLACCAPWNSQARGQAPEGSPLLTVGVEYAFGGLAETFAGLGIPAVKPYPDDYAWDHVQPRENGPYDFAKLDAIVAEYQQAGFTRVMLALKSRSRWASVHPKQNPTPRPEFHTAYSAWVQAVVERYDHDGRDDLPGLLHPVLHYEIGAEFSTYEPEPVADYLQMLELGYRAAHAACAEVVVLHAAILATTAFRDRPQPRAYAEAFAAVDPRIMDKSLADIRELLDRPDLYDAVNLHAIGDPRELEEMVRWLRYELAARQIERPLIVSDTTPNLLVGWGSGTRYQGDRSQLGILIPPATEADRPRLAKFLARLVEDDPAALAWVQAYVAADVVQRCVIAAEQGVAWINTAFMEDIHLLKLKLAQAGAGTSAWAGMAEVEINLFTQRRSVTGLRPAFHALRQLQVHWADATQIQRLGSRTSPLRIYRVERPRGPLWIAWLDVDRLVLPSDEIPAQATLVTVPAAQYVVESLIQRIGQEDPNQQQVAARNGKLRVELTHVPTFIYAAE